MTSRNAKTEVNVADELQNKVTQDLIFITQTANV